MRQTLAILNDVLISTQNLNPKELDFIANYIRDFKYNLRDDNNRNDRFINLYELYLESRANTYAEFILFLLTKCYNDNNDNFTSDITGYCRGNLPQTDEIRELLLRAIKDTNMTNRLRERFFWIFGDFREAARSFFETELGEFIRINEHNSQLVIDILSSMHWSINPQNPNLDGIRQIVIGYLNEHPEELNNVYFSDSTKRLLGLN